MATQRLQESQHIAALTCFHGEEALYCHGFTINFDSKLSVALAQQRVAHVRLGCVIDHVDCWKHVQFHTCDRQML